METIKIGYFADGPWSHLAFEKMMLNREIEISFITPRFNTKDQKLVNYAQSNTIDYVISENVNSEAYIEKIKKYECDLFVSMSFNQIFKDTIINLPKLKTINCHAGKLPFYRGRNVLNWVLINDEKEFGITVHYVDEGIDTGDIILQETYPITDEDDYKSLLNLAYEACASLLIRAVLLIKEGKVRAVKQNTIHPVGMYCGIRGSGDEIINWNQPSRDVFNFVRALCTPGPQAVTYSEQQEININKVRIVLSAPIYKGIPGQVLSKTKDNTFYVKTKDSFVEIIEYTGKLKVGKILKPISY